MLITSTSNPRVKYIRKLSERKFREQQGEYYIEGLRIVGEAIEQNADLQTLLYCPDLLTSEFGKIQVTKAQEKGIEVIEFSPEVFSKISHKEGPQGIAAIGRQKMMTLSSEKVGTGDIWIALDNVQDPGNLGTILRTGDAAGCNGLILLDHSTDPYDPTALRASMGAVYNLTICKADLSEFSQWKQETGMQVVGTSDKAKIYYRNHSYKTPMILLMGSEKMGLTPDHLRICDEVVSIPMLGKSDSLNLAVATGIVLYEIVHQSRMSRD